MDFNTVALKFTGFYYTNIVSGEKELRDQLLTCYKPHSMMTFESSHVQGYDAIKEKLQTIPFTKFQHKVATVDAQPSGENGSILVLVTGHVMMEDNERPQVYSQCFHLIPDGTNYYVLNDIFKLMYG